MNSQLLCADVAYLYQDLKLLAEEEHDQTLEYSSDADVLGKFCACARVGRAHLLVLLPASRRCVRHTVVST